MSQNLGDGAERIFDFRSDTVTRPTPRMRQAMMDAVVGDDVFSDDPTVQELERKAALILGMEAALFVPSGTMGNEVAINVWTDPGDEIIVEKRSHIYLYEAAGPALISGVQVCTIETPDGVMPLDQIEASLRDPLDVHCAITSLICIENTHNMHGGRVLPIDYLRELREFSLERRIPIHLDGARIFNASAATGVSPAEYASLADSVMFCLSKGLGAPIGSMVVGSEDFIEKAHRVRKVLGGGMRQVGVIAAPAIIALEEMTGRLRIDNENAKALAEGIADLPGLTLVPDVIDTNIVFARFDPPAPSAEEVAERLEEQGILCIPLGHGLIRFVTHFDVDETDVERLVDALREMLG
ncbi:MAG: aminotransferase class I/II-fold pyridoxal phosphate-dependent enzyme [Candidatus Coatesbacteria bacterium]|nr:aminotransferase class I/II-fold pyridoxal phosphate-dependent enzyme [Candidatus Coatesbacteria bacterium]